MKYLIQRNYKTEVLHKGVTLFGTGENNYSVHTDILAEERIDKNTVRKVTGLNEDDIKGSPVLTDEMKEIYLNRLPDVRKKVIEKYGESALDPTNDHFWKNRSTIRLDKNKLGQLHDDEENLADLILRFNILSGSFDDIAPSLETAKATGRNYYIIDLDDFNKSEFDDKISYKLKAVASLNELVEKSSKDALLYLTWVIVDDAKGYTKNTSSEVLAQVLYEYIEGALVKKNKKACAKIFYDNYNLWKTDKDSLITKAIFNAALYFGDIYLDKGQYTSKAGNTKLGTNEKKAIETLLDGPNIAELKELKKTIEEKLSK